MPEYECSHKENDYISPLSAPIVQTKLGKLEGFQIQLPGEKLANIFLGVPYAKSPLEQRRFEKPEMIEKWEDVKTVREFGPAAIPINFDQFDKSCTLISEDCLTLNIICPTSTKTKNQSEKSKLGLPTMVYVHGGGFCSGSASEYGYKQLAENFVPQGIIVVTIQYRLGPFGFLSLGNGTAMPGNLGLWDQALAVKFLYENIEAFGGDPKKITAAGLSAGAASAATLSLSPHSRDYICTTIEMSGTVLPEWSASERVIDASVELIECLLKEPIKMDSMTLLKSREIKERLKKVPLEDFRKAIRATGSSRYDINLLKFGPRIDGDFLPRDFPVLFREQISLKPSLIGLTTNEFMYFAIECKDPFVDKFEIERSKIEEFDETVFRKFVERCIIGGQFIKFLEKMPPTMIEEANKEICDFYLHDQQKSNGSKNFSFYLKQYTQLLSDVIFNIPVIWMSELRKQFRRPTFLYLNQYYNSDQFETWVPFKSSTHGNEYPYMNGLFPIGEFQFNQTDREHRQLLVSMMASFIKTGTPSIPNGKFDWPSNCQSSCNEKLQFVKISEQNEYSICEVSEELRHSVDFWNSFNRKYGFNLIRGIPNK